MFKWQDQHHFSQLFLQYFIRFILRRTIYPFVFGRSLRKRCFAFTNISTKAKVLHLEPITYQRLGTRYNEGGFQGHIFLQIFLRHHKLIDLDCLCYAKECEGRQRTKMRESSKGTREGQLKFDFVIVRLCPFRTCRKLISIKKLFTIIFYLIVSVKIYLMLVLGPISLCVEIIIE